MSALESDRGFMLMRVAAEIARLKRELYASAEHSTGQGIV